MKRITLILAFVAWCAAYSGATEGALNGRFTINPNGSQIVFSKGNLQYDTLSGTWSFAENQYDVIGYANGFNGIIDLFGWGTGNKPAQISTDTLDYNKFYDWGDNAISNGGNAAKQWRTPAYTDWYYIFLRRPNAEDLFALGSVNGVNGVILLPDDWKGPSLVSSVLEGLERTTNNYFFDEWENHDHYEDNVLTAEEWLEWEAQGAVFLPAAGYRSGKDAHVPNISGYYWTKTRHNKRYLAYSFNFYRSYLYPYEYYTLDDGQSVRLIQNAPVIVATDIDKVQGEDTQCTKVFRNGKLYLMRNGILYDMQGKQVR